MYSRILIPTDGSDLSIAAALAGIDFAKTIGASVVALHAAPPYQFPVYVDAVPYVYPTPAEHRSTARAYGQQCLDVISKSASDAGVGCSVDLQFAENPAAAIVKAAKRHGCDLIFIGSHGRGGLGTLILGSVASKVLSSCHTPVLVHRASRAELQQAQRLIGAKKPAAPAKAAKKARTAK